MLALLLFLPALALADSAQPTYMAMAFNIQSTTPTACIMVGAQGAGAIQSPIPGLDLITTGGVSTATVTSVNNLNPFAIPFAAGDIIVWQPSPASGQAQQTAVVQSVTNPNTIVLTAAITIASSGLPFSWWHSRCGTTANDGWADVSAYYEKDLLFQGDTIGAGTGIDVQWQCRMAGPFAQPVQVYPACTPGACGTVQNFLTGGIASRTNVVIYEPWNQCRALFNVHSGAPGTNSITITLTGRVRKP